MPSALSETLTSSLSGLSAPRPSLAPSAVSGGFEDALRAADKPAPTPVAADRGRKPVKKDEDPPPSQAQDDSKKDKDQESDTATAAPVVPLVAVALAAPADAPATPAATETTDLAIPAVGAKATVPTPAPATPQTATPAPQEDGQAASFTQVLADTAAAKTAGANAATDADATGTGTNADGGAATTQPGAAGSATANAAGAATTGTDDAAALANAGVSAVKGSLQPGATDASKTDAPAKPDTPAIPQAPAKPDATAAAKAEARNDAAKAAVDATAAKKDAAADTDKLASADNANDGQKLPTAPLSGTDASARTTQANTATPAAQANPGQAQAQAPVPLAAVPNEIAARAAKGATKFDIRLDPADLGRIDVHIDIDSDGRVTSRLFVERSETLALLKNDSRQLERSLEQAGFRTDPGSLQFSLRDSGAGNTGGNSFARQNWTPPAPSQPTVRAGVQDETSRTALDALYRSSSRASSGLDIRI